MAFGKLKVDELVTSTQTVSVDALVNVAADGDKGDITVSGTGTVWTIDAGVVDTSNLGGDITIAGKALLDDVDAAAQRTTLGAEAAGTAASAISTHEAAADPHPGYALESSLATVATTGALGDLGDVDLTTTPPADGEALVYDSATGEWVPGAAGATAAGSANEIQYNDGASGLAASADLTWDNTGKVLGVGGDIDLDDGGTYTTTLQTITPTANRTVSIPDATGTVALVAGSNGQLVYNNAGAYAGASGSSVGASGDITLSANGAASTGTGSAFKLTGSWYTGANPVPQALIQPAGTATSTTWSTSGTGLGVNAASGFTGNLLDLQVNGTSRFRFGTTRLDSASDGTNAVISSSTHPNRGFGYAESAGHWFVRTFDGPHIAFRRFSFTVPSTFSIGWSDNTGTSNTYDDLAIFRDAAGILAQRNGGTDAAPASQTFRLYNFSVDPANDYERTSITDDSTGLVIDQQYAGTGAARTNLLDLKNNGTSKFAVDSNGAIHARGGQIRWGDVGNEGYININGAVIARLNNTSFGVAQKLSLLSGPYANPDISLARDQAGVVAITDGSTGTGYLKQTPVPVGSLPAAATVGAGTRGFVSDSTVAASGNFGAIVAGLGSNNVPVFSDGTNWLIG